MSVFNRGSEGFDQVVPLALTAFAPEIWKSPLPALTTVLVYAPPLGACRCNWMLSLVPQSSRISQSGRVVLEACPLLQMRSVFTPTSPVHELNCAPFAIRHAMPLS